MGLGFVLGIWLVVGSILAGIGSAILVSVTSNLTRGIDNALRRSAIRAARLLPFGCLIWAGIIFVIQGIVNEQVFHRDVGIGDSSYAPLPNGYQILFGDLTDQGTVRLAGSQDGVNGVRLLQVSGPYLLGGMDIHWFDDQWNNTNAIDSYFVIDTRTGKRTIETDLSALTSEASRLGVSLHLEPIYTVYSRYRFTWFDVVAGCILILPPFAALIALGVWLIRLRRARTITATP